MASVGISFVVEGKRAFQDAIDRMVARAEATARQIVKDGGEIIKTEAQAHTPVASGQLQASIRVARVTPLGSGAWMSETGPTSLPYARRLELGFHEHDSLSRDYKQAGHWFLDHAFKGSKDRLAALSEERWATSLRG